MPNDKSLNYLEDYLKKVSEAYHQYLAQVNDSTFSFKTLSILATNIYASEHSKRACYAVLVSQNPSPHSPFLCKAFFKVAWLKLVKRFTFLSYFFK